MSQEFERTSFDKRDKRLSDTWGNAITYRVAVGNFGPQSHPNRLIVDGDSTGDLHLELVCIPGLQHDLAS